MLNGQGPDPMEALLDWLSEHRLPLVFVASVIDATGLPFPGRLVLVFVGAVAASLGDLAVMALLATVGFVIGDHVLFGAGAVGGRRVLRLYCRLSLGSADCVERTLAYVRRYGPTAVLFGRFSAGVRLFAAVLAGAGHIRYRSFLVFDLAGSLIYAALWLGLGHLFGMALLDRIEAVRVLVFAGPAAIVTVLAFRWLRRRRYGAASQPRLGPPAEPDPMPSCPGTSARR
jgi:membrane protein DedA with SNARE-associated domain